MRTEGFSWVPNSLLTPSLIWGALPPSSPPLLPEALTRFLNRAEQQFPGMLFSRATVLLMISPVLSLGGRGRGPGMGGACVQG